MNEPEFITKYCISCGTQRCEGPSTEWFEGCPKRWNLDEYGDAAAEIEKLNNKVMELGSKLVNSSHTEPAIGGPVGWVCPKCGRALSPYTSECPCSVKYEFTCRTGTPILNSGHIISHSHNADSSWVPEDYNFDVGM